MLAARCRQVCQTDTQSALLCHGRWEGLATFLAFPGPAACARPSPAAQPWGLVVPVVARVAPGVGRVPAPDLETLRGRHRGQAGGFLGDASAVTGPSERALGRRPRLLSGASTARSWVGTARALAGCVTLSALCSLSFLTCHTGRRTQWQLIPLGVEVSVSPGRRRVVCCWEHGTELRARRSAPRSAQGLCLPGLVQWRLGHVGLVLAAQVPS